MNSPQGPPWFDVLALCAEREEVYPIHVAASLGNAQVVKLLLRQGADKEKDTSKGVAESDLTGFFKFFISSSFS